VNLKTEESLNELIMKNQKIQKDSNMINDNIEVAKAKADEIIQRLGLVVNP